MIMKWEMKVKKRELKHVKKAIVKFLKKHRGNYYSEKEITDGLISDNTIFDKIVYENVHRALSDLQFSPFNLVRREYIELYNEVYTYGY